MRNVDSRRCARGKICSKFGQINYDELMNSLATTFPWEGNSTVLGRPRPKGHAKRWAADIR